MAEPSAHPEQRNVETISRLERDALRSRSVAERLSDGFTKTIGSLPSIGFHLAWLACWVLINTGQIPGLQPFDPFPFGILTLIVSTEGV